jgi:hypothetical protein
MPLLDIKRRALKFIETLDKKQAGQIARFLKARCPTLSV